jgi:hypothetical protein
MNEKLETIKAIINALNTAENENTQPLFEAIARRLSDDSLANLKFLFEVEQTERDLKNRYNGWHEDE